MTLEVRFAISPTFSFFGRAGLIAKSIREFYPDAIVRASVGGSNVLPGDIRDGNTDILYHWLDGDDFDAWAGTDSPYLATVNDTWRGPFTGDHILHLDADVLCTAGFDELFNGTLCGVQAHVPPCPREEWERLFEGFGIATGTINWIEHSGAGIMCPPHTMSPVYFNSGMVLGPRALFERLEGPYFEAIAYLKRALRSSYWFDQLALALAIAKAQVPVTVLPLRFNFPNRPAFDQRHPLELTDLRFLHYLQTDIVDRGRDFATAEARRALVARTDLTGSNERLRARVAELIG